MERKVINPWTWQDERHYVQAVDVKHPDSTLYISGQTAIDEHGVASSADFESQLRQSIKNLEKVISQASYKNSDIVRLTIYTTSFEKFGQHFEVFQEWVQLNDMKVAATVVEVSKLFETTVVELEAIAAK